MKTFLEITGAFSLVFMALGIVFVGTFMWYRFMEMRARRNPLWVLAMFFTTLLLVSSLYSVLWMLTGTEL